MVAEAERLGLSMMIDLVINHCAVDSSLVKEHPDWFLHDGKKIANPFCVEADGTKVVWYDLAQFDHEHSPERADLLDYCVKLVLHLVSLGFRGFRCDAAYQIPNAVWEQLIARVRREHPGPVFVAETLGCSPEQTKMTAAAAAPKCGMTKLRPGKRRAIACTSMGFEKRMSNGEARPSFLRTPTVSTPQ